jgi:hypothetical protein
VSSAGSLGVTALGLVAGLRPTRQAGGHGPAGAVWRASTVLPGRRACRAPPRPGDAVSYAAIPDRAGAKVRRWRSAAARLRQLREDRQRRRKLRAAQRHEAAAQAAVRQLGGELAVLVPSCLLPSRPPSVLAVSGCTGRRCTHALAQHLAAFARRRSRRCRDRSSIGGAGRHQWCWRPGQGSPQSVDEQDYEDQVTPVTMAAKPGAVRRGLLDITHGLRRSRPPQAPPAHPDGVPTKPAQ